MKHSIWALLISLAAGAPFGASSGASPGASPGASTGLSTGPWQPYLGCYDTESANGKTLPQDRRLTTSLTEGLASNYDAQTGEAIPAVKFMIYRGRDASAGADIIDATDAFTDRGAYHRDEAGLHYLFQGWVVAEPKSRERYLLQQSIDLKELGFGRIHLRVVVNLNDSGSSSVNEYVLQARACRFPHASGILP